MKAILTASEVAEIAGMGNHFDSIDLGALVDSHEALRAKSDAWQAYAEHRETCRECWIKIRDDAGPERGLCEKGAVLRRAVPS